jgi:TatA/E family protein of Tat protein translocase
MFGFGGLGEILFIAFLAMLIFGPEKLPEIGRTLAKAMAEVRKASNELKRTLNSELAVVEQERNARRIQELDAAATTAPLGYIPPPPMMPTAPPPDTQPVTPGGFAANTLAVPETTTPVEPAALAEPAASVASEPVASEAAVGAAPEPASIPAHPAVAAEPAAQHALFPPYGEGHAPHHAPPADGDAP